MYHDLQIAQDMFTRPSLTQTTIDTYLKQKKIAPVLGGHDLDPPYTLNLKQSPASNEPNLQAEIALAPDMGSHRFYSDAVFAYTNTMQFDEIVLFITTLRQSGFDGDIVLSVNLDKIANANTTSTDEQDRQNLIKFLKYHSQPLGGVVVYNGVIRSQETDETLGHDMDVEEDLAYLRGLYRIKGTEEILEDERIARTIGVARFELFWVWSQKYSPTSRILLIDAHDTFFQEWGAIGIGSQRTCSHGNRTSADISSVLHIYEENKKGMTHRLDKIENRTMIVEAYKDHIVLKFLYNENVITPASTHGHQKAIETYLRAMVKQFDNTQCYKYRCEWAFQNYISYLGVLLSTPEIDEVKIHMQGTGAVNSIGQDIPLNTSKIYNPKTHIVTNLPMGHGHQPSWSVHQYKEDEELYQIINNTKKALVRAIDYNRPLPLVQSFDSLHKTSISANRKPLIGQHRQDKNAIFSIVDATNLNKLALFILSARNTGFEGDIVLHTPKLDGSDVGAGVADFLRKQAAHNYVVIYEGDMKIEGSQWILHDFYEDRSTGKHIPDPRPPRPRDLVSIEMFAAWTNYYDPSSIIILLDGEQSYFQKNPLEWYWNKCHDLEINFNMEHESVKRFKRLDEQDKFVADAVRGMFTTADLNAFSDKSLLIPNAISGHQETVRNFLTDMLNTFEAFKCYQYGCDWAAINYLWYKDRLSGISSISYQMAADKYGDGIIHALPSFAVVKEIKLFDEKYTVFKNLDESVSPIVIGYDYDELKTHFEEVAEKLLANA